MVIIGIFVIFLSLVWMLLLFINLWLLCVFFLIIKKSVHKECRTTEQPPDLSVHHRCCLAGPPVCPATITILEYGHTFQRLAGSTQIELSIPYRSKSIIFTQCFKAWKKGAYLITNQKKKKKNLRIVEYYYLPTIR